MIDRIIIPAVKQEFVRKIQIEISTCHRVSDSWTWYVYHVFSGWAILQPIVCTVRKRENQQVHATQSVDPKIDVNYIFSGHATCHPMFTKFA